MDDKQVEDAYNRLAFLHAETMQDNAFLREQLEAMAGNWRRQLVAWVKLKLGITKWYE